MGRWPVVAQKRNLANAQKQKIFSIHAKLIALRARHWGDPDKNPTLAEAIVKAKKDNVPNENIERAIKKWTWEDKNAAVIESIIYEWYGAWGVACIVSTLSDNKNRTAANMRHIFSKYGGNLWESWSVSFQFEKLWFFAISLEKYSLESLEEMIFETSAKDFFVEDGMMKILTSLDDFWEVKTFLEEKGVETQLADIEYIATNTIQIDDFDTALKLTKLFQDLDDDEDVEKVAQNMIIWAHLQKQVDEFIEKNTFHT